MSGHNTMLTDLLQRAYTDLFPTSDCYCGARIVEERVRKTEPGEWAYSYGVWITQHYNLNGDPHFCSREDRARALERNQQEALTRVNPRIEKEQRRKRR